MKTKIAERRRARSLLVQALYQQQIAKTRVPDLEAQFRASQTAKIDWAFFHDILVETLGQVEELDADLAPRLDRKLEELTPVEHAILRLGLCELKTRIDVPYRVVINEYVELAKKFGAAESHRYVNGILDSAAKTYRSIERQARS